MEDCCGGGGVTVELSSSDVLLSEVVVLGVLGSGVLTSELLVSSAVEGGGAEVRLVEEEAADELGTSEVAGASEEASDVSTALLWVDADDGVWEALETDVLLGVTTALDSGVGSTVTVSCGTLIEELLLERVNVTGVCVIVGGSTGVSVTSIVDPGTTTASAVGLRRVTVVSISVRVCT
jgi:hypothetical protein